MENVEDEWVGFYIFVSTGCLHVSVCVRAFACLYVGVRDDVWSIPRVQNVHFSVVFNRLNVSLK